MDGWLSPYNLLPSILPLIHSCCKRSNTSSPGASCPRSATANRRTARRAYRNGSERNSSQHRREPSGTETEIDPARSGLPALDQCRRRNRRATPASGLNARTHAHNTSTAKPGQPKPTPVKPRLHAAPSHRTTLHHRTPQHPRSTSRRTHSLLIDGACGAPRKHARTHAHTHAHTYTAAMSANVKVVSR